MPDDQDGVSRRGFMGAAVAASGVLSMASHSVAPQDNSSTAVPSLGDNGSPVDVEVNFFVNGVDHRLQLDPRATLLDTLRERLQLTGTKKGCDHGQCGACTVLVDGRRIYSCLTLVVTLTGSHVTTVEGLSRGDQLHPVQQAFIDHDAFQCGYCTSGQICSAVGLLREGHAQSDDEVRELMSGNLCRCGAYQNIVAAVQAARITRV